MTEREYEHVQYINISIDMDMNIDRNMDINMDNGMDMDTWKWPRIWT
jgi:hypothetical protein